MSDDSSSTPPGRRTPGTDFDVHVHADGGAGSTVRVSGELDADTAALMREGLALAARHGHDRVVVDVTRLGFIDASGIAALVSAHLQVVADGRPGVAVRGAHGIVREVFELTHLDDLLDDTAPTSAPPSADEAVGDAELQHVLLEVCRDAGLSLRELFVSYFALGGTADLDRFVRHLSGDGAELDRHQQVLAAHAVGEHMAALGCGDVHLAAAST